MKKLFVILSIVAMFVLSACGNQSNSTNLSSNTTNDHSAMSHMDNMDMSHSSTGEVPKGLMEAKNPTYKVGDEAVIHARHMEGMDGAKAKVVGAYDTIAYAVTYTPTTGGKKVSNHKWVIQEEIKDAGKEPLKPGTSVTLNADHMKGMMGAQGTIDSAEKTTVYMVDYTPTTGGEPVKNHKWVVESELSKN